MRLPRTKVLDPDEVQKIHEASLSLLENPGILVFNDQVLELLSDAGCRVEKVEGGGMARIPGSLVEESLDWVPPRISLYNRDLEPALTLGDGKVRCASGHNAIFVQDGRDGERRPATKADVAGFARIADRLDRFSVVGIEAMPQDVPPRASLVHAAEAVLTNTRKPLYYSPETHIENRAIMDMARVVSGTDDLADKPMLACQVSSSSPLCWTGGAAQALVETCRAGIPVSILAEPSAGGTAPITLAGLLTVHNTEVLSGVVMSQLVRKGTPVIYGTAWTTLSMRTALATIGSPESALLRVAGAQLAEFYGFPSHAIGPDSDSNCYDEQQGWEKILTAFAALSSGVTLMVNSGMFATGLTVSFEQLIVDHEIVNIVYRLLDGIEVNADTIALDVISSAGPRGDFLMSDHTLRYLRSGEHLEKAVANQVTYDAWRSLGSPDVVENAGRIAKEILGSHEPVPLKEGVRKELRTIVQEFESSVS